MPSTTPPTTTTPQPVRPAARPARPARRTTGRWALAGAVGVGAGVTIALRVPFVAETPALGAIVAIAAGWGVLLGFAPWGALAELDRKRTTTLRLASRLRDLAAGNRDHALRELIIDRDDELGELSRAIYETLTRAVADRHEAKQLQRSMHDSIRRETSRATHQLRRAALTDPLTGLGNRRTLEERLEELFGEGENRRRGDRVMAMVIDLDGFKAINDTLGHDVGDECLVFLGRLLASTLRSDDCAARLGGDEFVVLMPEIAAHEAEAVARRIGALFQQMPWPHDRVARPTLSVGVASAHRADPRGGQELLRRADAAMYASKSAGRSRVTTYEQAA